MTPSTRPGLHLRFWTLALLAGAATSVTGCSGVGEATSGGYRSDLGWAPSAQTLAGVSAEVLQLYGFDLESVETDLIQTDWRHPQDGVRDRATVRVRPRGSDLYVGSIRLAVETQGDGGSWRPAAPPAEVRDQYEDILADIRTRLERFMTRK